MTQLESHSPRDAAPGTRRWRNRGAADAARAEFEQTFGMHETNHDTELGNDEDT